MSTDQAILASLQNIEALLTRLLEKQTAEVTHPHTTVDEEISLVLQQGIDPVDYLRAKQAKHAKRREARQ